MMIATLLLNDESTVRDRARQHQFAESCRTGTEDDREDAGPNCTTPHWNPLFHHAPYHTTPNHALPHHYRFMENRKMTVLYGLLLGYNTFLCEFNISHPQMAMSPCPLIWHTEPLGSIAASTLRATFVYLCNESWFQACVKLLATRIWQASSNFRSFKHLVMRFVTHRTVY